MTRLCAKRRDSSPGRPGNRGTTTRCLGLDIGDRRIGVALSDPGGILASPHSIIERPDDETAIRTLLDIITSQEVAQIISGLPLSADGTSNLQAEKIKSFIGTLSARTDVPVEFRDERYSTLEAQRLLREARPKDFRSRKKRARSRDDAAAAAIILQGYLEEQH